MRFKISEGLFFLAVLITCLRASDIFAQTDNRTLVSKQDYLNKVNSKTQVLNKRIEKTDKKYLKKYFRAENKLHRKLCKTDPVLADRLFSSSSDPLYYNQKNATHSNLLNDKPESKEYFAKFDTLKSSLNFFDKNKEQVADADKEPLNKSKNDVNILDRKLNKSDKLQQYFRKRKTEFKDALAKNPSLKKEFKGIDKVNYYYHEQIAEYKKSFEKSSKPEEIVLNTLRGNDAFKNFMQKNGQLASFSRAVNSQSKNLSALQTMVQTKELIKQDISNLRDNPKEILDGKIQPMTESLTKIKNLHYGSVTNAADIPSFKPNPLKTKRFIDRLEYGTNFSVNNKNNFFPATTNAGIQVSYKIINENTIGIGASHQFGLGNSWNRIHMSDQGIGLRSFVDMKIKNSLFLEGGYEKNYKPQQASAEIKNKNGFWYDSALLGLKLKKRISKKGSPTLCLLYDFLCNQHTPQTSTLIYRMGWEW